MIEKDFEVQVKVLMNVKRVKCFSGCVRIAYSLRAASLESTLLRG